MEKPTILTWMHSGGHLPQLVGLLQVEGADGFLEICSDVKHFSIKLEKNRTHAAHSRHSVNTITTQGERKEKEILLFLNGIKIILKFFYDSLPGGHSILK